jgi:signal peptidase I
LPKIARTAYIVAFVIAGLGVIGALMGPIVALPLALIPLVVGIGILRGRVWSAYGFALYELAQLLLVPLVLLRSGGSQKLTGLIAIAALTAVLCLLFLFAGRSLAATGSKRGWAWPWIAVSLLATIPMIFVEPYVMPTGSMEDTLLIGDRLLVQRVPKPPLEPGGMIVFVYPIDRRQTFIKRVIGVPGDHIRISKKIAYRNGTALQEPYALHKTSYEDAYRDNFPSEPNVHLAAPALEMLAKDVVNGEVVVPEGKYFVLGDSRDDSFDSRYWGFVDSGDLIGKPLLIYDSEEQPVADVVSGAITWPHKVRWGRLFKLL